MEVGDLGEDIPTPFRELPLPAMMMVLNTIYGSRVVAFAIQEEYAQVERFAAEQEQPTEPQEQALRDMAEIAEILTARGLTANAIRILMFGKNASFDGEAPITLITNKESSRVVRAAPGFMSGYK